MKLIFINRFFHPDHSATSQLLSDLAFGLASNGYAVSTITGRQYYDGADRPLPSRETIAGVEVHRVWASRFGRGGLLGRAIDYTSFYLSSAWRLWRLARRGNVVISKTDPPMLSVLTGPIARMRGAHTVNWLQDVFPEVAERLDFGGRIGRLGFGLLRRLRNRSLRSAYANVVLGDRMADRLAALGIPREHISVIPNWADGKSVMPIALAANVLRREWGLSDHFVVGYSGNLGRAHDMETMLDAIGIVERWQKGATSHKGLVSDPRISWLFIGGGNLLNRLKAKVTELGFTTVRFEPYQPREQLAQSLSAVDIHLVSLRPELEGLIVPSKFYGIAAAGRPTIFIGDRKGEIAQTIARTRCGLSVAQGDGAALANAILTLAAEPNRCAEMGAAARKAFDAEFDKPIAIARWEELLGRIARDSAAGQNTQFRDRAAARSASASRNAR